MAVLNTLEAIVYRALKAHPSVQSLVGSRIAEAQLDQTPGFPSLVFSVSSATMSTHDMHPAGAEGEAEYDRTQMMTVRLRALSKLRSAREAREVARAATDAFLGIAGTHGTIVVSGPRIDEVSEPIWTGDTETMMVEVEASCYVSR